MSTLIRNGWIITMNAKRQVLHGDLRFTGGEIREVGANLEAKDGETVVDAAGSFVIPGLIQTHTHVIQTLFRGCADDLELLDWLQEKIWPFENAHNEASAKAAARLGLLEMQLLGTTAILDMGTVRLHEAVFEEVEASGMRYWGGNCLMDHKSSSGPLYRATEDTLAYCEELIQEWHRKTPLIEYAVSPRFAISCTDQILKAAVQLQKKHGLLFHTHASENKGEVALVKKRTGLDNVRYLKKMGCLNSSTVIAHAIHLGKAEIADLAKAKTGISHCPSSNLKLASGLARITEYQKRGVKKIGIGADGAACNNMMDPFMEIRMAALLQKPMFGPTALPAFDAFELGTIGGARVLNAEKKIGSLEKGKRADIVLVKRNHPGVATVEDPYSALVYSCSGRDVSHVWIDGRAIVQDAQHLIFDCAATVEKARAEMKSLLKRKR